MNATFQTKTKSLPAPAVTSTDAGLLQRRCTCSGGEDCRQCEKEQSGTRSAQTNLTLSRPGDRYEQEADRVAEQVMRVPALVGANAVPGPAPPPTISRWTRSADTDEIRRQSPANDEDAEELLNDSSLLSFSSKDAGPSAPAVTPDLAAAVRSMSGGRPLPADVRAFFEPRFQHDFGRVRVHADARAAQNDARIERPRVYARRGYCLRGGRVRASYGGRPCAARARAHACCPAERAGADGHARVQLPGRWCARTYQGRAHVLQWRLPKQAGSESADLSRGLRSRRRSHIRRHQSLLCTQMKRSAKSSKIATGSGNASSPMATSLSSSDVDYASNPEFEAIVDMGEVAIPFIIEKLRIDDSAHFLIHALEKIMGKRFTRNEIEAGERRHGAPLGDQGFAAMWEEWWSRRRGANE